MLHGDNHHYNDIKRQAVSVRKKIGDISLIAMLFALALILSWIESFLPPPPVPLPIRYGLSNIAVMYALFALSGYAAIIIAVLKSAFVLMMRGILAGALSLSGGLLSVIVMILLMYIFKNNISYLLLSVCGAFSHNIGQIIILKIIYTYGAIALIFPFLSLLSVATGCLTALWIKPLLPVILRYKRKFLSNSAI